MPQTTRILVVDDDPQIRILLARYLKDQGFEVPLASNRRELEQKLSLEHVDLVVLDLMLPDGSGLDICRDLRATGSTIPIILLTALKEDVDRIIGLEIGADDYLGKPFNPRELVARIRAVLRRRSEPIAQSRANRTYHFDGFSVDPHLRNVLAPDGAKIVLTGAEFDLLQTFLDRPGRLLSRDQLLDLTRGNDGEILDRSIDVLVSRLRRKLGDAGAPNLFKTVRNGGYQFAAKVEVSDTGP
ncbi:response regulator [Hyphomicrobium sp. MC1]|uniref:response regulator n=1 Tax=Hyphomicrobium sp. (strain MC1) TaxID=717785 RepID=UPI00059E97C1|nr:response regulator [Hyphomicrobium sp. MC1]